MLSIVGCRSNVPDSLSLEVPSKPNEYSKKLVHAIGSINNAELKYGFRGYELLGDQEYIRIHAFGDSVNAVIPILVRQWNKSEGIRTTKGVGYNGAELNGLELKLANDAIAKFEYKTLDKIID